MPDKYRIPDGVGGGDTTARHIENREKTGNEIDKDLKTVERRNFVVLNAKFTADFRASVAYFSHVKHHICILLDL